MNLSDRVEKRENEVLISTIVHMLWNNILALDTELKKFGKSYWL